MQSDLPSWETSLKDQFGQFDLLQLWHLCDHGGVIEVARYGLRPANMAYCGYAHGIEEGLHTSLITPFGFN